MVLGWLVGFLAAGLLGQSLGIRQLALFAPLVREAVGGLPFAENGLRFGSFQLLSSADVRSGQATTSSTTDKIQANRVFTAQFLVRNRASRAQRHAAACRKTGLMRQ